MFFQKIQKHKKRLSESFGQLKIEKFNFDLISRYLSNSTHENNAQILSEQICNDLDFDLFFCYIDRTHSKIGQQYLYKKLKTILHSQDQKDYQEQIIDFFEKHPEIRLNIQLQLEKLNTNQAYYMCDLFQKEIEKKSKWYILFPFLSIFSLVLILLSFAFPNLFLIYLFVLPIHVLIHYGLKRKTTLFINSIPSLLSLGAVAKYLSNHKNLTQNNPQVLDSLKVIASIRRKMTFFKLEQKLDSDMEAAYWFLLEFIKIVLLLEPLLLFSSIDTVQNKTKEIKQVFDFVGQIEACISICSLRKGLDNFCIPEFSIENTTLKFEDLRHPLVENCVPNSFVAHKSVLLTGSNMSGKSTFIRSIGLNFISGMTLNTCFATTASFPFAQLFTMIRIEDDLMNSSSYFFKEVDEINKIIKNVGNDSFSLILLDELFKGTNSKERIASAKAVLSYLEKSNSKIFVSTHDLELTHLLADKFELYHFSEHIENEKILFDYKLKNGIPSKSNAIRILELNNFPDEIISEAKQIANSNLPI